MKLLAWLAGCIAVIIAALVLAAPSTSRVADSGCPLGQQSVGSKCQNYSSKSDLRDDAERIMASLSVFAQENNVSQPPPGMLVYIHAGQHVSGMDDTPTIDDELIIRYDGHGHMMVGAQSLFSVYTQQGTIAPEVVIPHEFGHFIQEMAGIIIRTATDDTQALMRQEAQPDCVAGAYIRWLGTRQPITQADDQAIANLYGWAGGTPGHPGANQRLDAFRQGRSGGLAACNSVGNGSITTSKEAIARA